VKKRIVSVFLVLCMILSFNVTVMAQEEHKDNLEAMKEIVSYFNIMKGDPDGNFRLSDNITRAEFTKVSVAASKYKDYVAPNAYISPFKVVKYTHWAAPYVKVALDNGIMAGYEDGSFRPDKNVTMEEIVTVYLRLLGYSDSEFGISWPYGQIATAKDIGLSENVEIVIGKTATREEVLKLSYNLLSTKSKGSGSDYISILNHSIVEDVVLLDIKGSQAEGKNDEIVTSNGTYKVGEDFDFSYMGFEGDICIDSKSNKIVNFVPNDGIMEKHTVYNALQNEVVTYKDGLLSSLKLDSSTVIYDNDKLSNSNSVISKMEMGDGIYVKYDMNSGVDYMIYKPGNLEGPVTVKNKNWYTNLGINPDTASITRNGEKVTKDSIALDDIIYSSSELNMVMAYSKKVTGIYEKATPNRDMPSSVTVSGVSYDLEGINAFNALSSVGNLSYGDTVTLLIGKEGAVADAMKAGDVTVNTAIVGYLMSTGQKTYTDANNNEYSSYYISVLLPDGTVSEYKTQTDFKKQIGEICSVSFDGSSAKVKAGITGAEVYGKVNSEENTIGSFKVASDVKIIDISGYQSGINEPMKYTALFLQRIDGVNLSANSVLYAGYNEKKEIDTLILKEVSGDMYEYGLVTKLSVNKDSGVKSYTCFMDGKEYSDSGKGINVPPAGEGGKIITNQNGSGIYRITTMFSISPRNIASVTLSNVVAGDGTVYTYADKVQVYRMTPSSNGVYYTYTKMPLDDLVKVSDNASITVYYDKKDSSGGRVRVITVKEN